MEFRTAEDYLGAEGLAEVEVEVPRGATMAQIGQVLQDADVIKSSDTFRQYARTRPDEAAKVQAGTYRMRTQISSEAAFDPILNAAASVAETTSCSNESEVRSANSTSPSTVWPVRVAAFSWCNHCLSARPPNSF